MALNHGGTYNPPSRVEGAITGTYGTNDWLLVWTLDSAGSILSISRPSTVSASTVGCNSYTYAQLVAYKSGTYSQILFTSVLYPEIKWVFDLADNPTNLPLVLQAIMIGPPHSYMTINTAYSVTLNQSSSSPTIGSDSDYRFEHNNSGAEAGDIPTFGLGTVWSNGMFWGNIDAFTNYGGLLNTITAHLGSSGGTTGDRLLVYAR